VLKLKENMKKETENTLKGDRNDRLDKCTPICKENTAAWSETDKTIKTSNVTIPSQANVINAKEWVDDGSRL
jgi:hypothetical protein